MNNIKIENYFSQLTMRLLPKITNDLFEIVPDKNGLITYDSIMISSKFTKPTLLEYEAEFALLKDEMIAAEKARLAEIARVEDITKRFRAIKNIHQVAFNIKKHQPNMEMELLRIIESDDQVTLSELETENVIVEDKERRRKIREIKKEKGSKKSKVCKEILKLISGDNDEKLKKDSEIDAMLVSFKPIYDALKQNRPMKAKTMINAVPYDGIIDELKDEILEEFTEHGF